MSVELSRAALAVAGIPADPAPARIVHLGLGAFHRAHQAWYTDRADARREWGIAAFTGRSPAAAHPLAAQDGLFSLTARAPHGDTIEIVRSIVAAGDGAEPGALLTALARPTTAIVTLTITEAGYRLRPDRTVDPADAAVAADLDRVRLLGRGGAAEEVPSTTLGRLLAGLELRRRAGAPPLAIVPCDNMPSNGALVRDALLALAATVDDRLAAYVADEVAFVSTSVDRITPAARDEDARHVERQTGWIDAAPVVTERFTDWVLEGAFPSGRPEWEAAGARFVADVGPFERRKLWMLNGAHSLLASAGLLAGHATVHEAIDDPACRAAVEGFWSEAAAHLPATLDLVAYREALLDRFANPRIEHRLAQIARDGASKVRVRALPVLRAERAAGRSGVGAARIVGAWMDAAAAGVLPEDADAARTTEALASREPTRALLAVLDPELADDAGVLDVVVAARGMPVPQ